MVYMDMLMAADGSQVSALCLLDLSAVFDTINHDLLMQRLEREYGLRGVHFIPLWQNIPSRTSVRHHPSTSNVLYHKAQCLVCVCLYCTRRILKTTSRNMASVSTRSPTTRSCMYTVFATTWRLPFYDSRTASRKSATVCLSTASSWTRTQQSCSGLGHVMVRLCWEALVRLCSLALKRSRRVTKSVSLAWRWRRSDLCLDKHVASVCATCF